MAQSDALKNYVPRTLTQSDATDVQNRYLKRELANIQQAIALLNQVVKQIDARLIAHGI